MSEAKAATATPSIASTLPNKSETKLTFSRVFTNSLKAGSNPYDEIEWEKRLAQITDSQGNVIFEQKDVEVPKDWSMTATNIVASKYLHGTIGSIDRESGVRALIFRVVNTIRNWGESQKYFDKENADIFENELTYILLHQYAAFNSPVWFNVGCDRIDFSTKSKNWHWNFDIQQVEYGEVGYTKPQCSACFINSVEDSMESILTLAKTEGMLFKWGSGTGTNLSPLRASNEGLSGGGLSSGPLSFMKGYDAFAGVIKSGGRVRRAAKMVLLDVDHPDILEFIHCKAKEEAKANALISVGYDGSSPDAEAYASIFFQNANNSVRVTDEFMHQVVTDGLFETKARRDGKVVNTYRAKEIMKQISEATWKCGDPGIQYDTTINKWHTVSNTDRINASNPCAEYMHLDDSACNLASINLLKLCLNGSFDVEAYKHTIDILITAQEILVDNAGYPTEKIAKNSHDYRPLGLGYANLGALLMSVGLPYDSNAGRDYAACVTAIMCGEAYLQSSKIAQKCNTITCATEKTKEFMTSDRIYHACPGWFINREPFLNVIRMHRASVNKINKSNVPSNLHDASKQVWDEALASGEKYGYRNAQVTVLAPTGTIGFMMDCDTTGVEPDLALVKYKKLVGGGVIKIVNNTVPAALFKLGYIHDQVDKIVSYVDATGTIEGAPNVKDEHLAIFDCSFKPAKGTRSISYMGHILMMAATQPFISGAISKTVNLPESATVEDIMEAYTSAWKHGLKAVAIYRDGCKKSQPLSAAGSSTALSRKEDLKINPYGPPIPTRTKLQKERRSITHKFDVGGHEGYITAGLYPDDSVGEIFVTMAKEGSTVSGLMDSFSCAISIGLQHGVPLNLLCEKFSHTRFEPSGWTGNPEIGFAKSIMDYIFRWLELRFLRGQQQNLFERLHLEPGQEPKKEIISIVEMKDVLADDSPACHYCGTIMTRNGSCYKCGNCGSTSGCS